MKLPTLTILTGRKGINDWFELNFMLSNHFDIRLSLLGYGFDFNWVMKDSIKEFMEEE